MSKKEPEKMPRSTGETREDRLKQALKANLARRKAQAKARDMTTKNAAQDKG